MNKAQDRLPKSDIFEFRFLYGNMILVDVEPGYVSEILGCVAYKVPIEFQSLSSLARILRLQIPFETYERILWPGTGAQTVQKLLDIENLGERIDARRVGYKNPRFEIGNVTPKDQKTIIIDDVICSGGTVLAIKEKAKIKQCDIACLVMQCPRNSNLKTFEKVYSSLVIKSEQGKAPLNSLSTFLKNESIAIDYANRFVIDPQEFLDALDLIRKEATFYA